MAPNGRRCCPLRRVTRLSMRGHDVREPCKGICIMWHWLQTRSCHKLQADSQYPIKAGSFQLVGVQGLTSPITTAVHVQHCSDVSRPAKSSTKKRDKRPQCLNSTIKLVAIGSPTNPAPARPAPTLPSAQCQPSNSTKARPSRRVLPFPLSSSDEH
jgi:hypothetical protein